MNALVKAIPSIANVFIVCLVFWLIFGIVGVQFFAGKFYKCKDGEGNIVNHTIVENRSMCLSHPDNYTWENSPINFDNVANAYLALFQVVSSLVQFQDKGFDARIRVYNVFTISHGIFEINLSNTCIKILISKICFLL